MRMQHCVCAQVEQEDTRLTHQHCYEALATTPERCRVGPLSLQALIKARVAAESQPVLACRPKLKTRP